MRYKLGTVSLSFGIDPAFAGKATTIRLRRKPRSALSRSNITFRILEK